MSTQTTRRTRTKYYQGGDGYFTRVKHEDEVLVENVSFLNDLEPGESLASHSWKESNGPTISGDALDTAARDSKRATVLFASADGVIVNITVDNVLTTITEGSEWSKDTDDDTSAAALVTYINANVPGVTAARVDNVVMIGVDGSDVLTVTSQDGAGGGTAFVVANAAKGVGFTITKTGNVILRAVTSAGRTLDRNLKWRPSEDSEPAPRYH